MATFFENAPDSFKRMICSALRNALEVEMLEIMEEHAIEERDGYGQFRWNVIMSNLKGKCKFFGVCQRRSWRFPVVYYPEMDYLITFMTDERLAEMQRKKDKGMHYLCAASCWNRDVVAQEEQLRMDFPHADIDDSWIKKSQEQMAECVDVDPQKVKGHILVAFTCKSDVLTNVQAMRLTANLDISTETENWTSYIEQPYAEANTVIDPQITMDDDDDEQMVSLK